MDYATVFNCTRERLEIDYMWNVIDHEGFNQSISSHRLRYPCNTIESQRFNQSIFKEFIILFHIYNYTKKIL